jgi:putative peptidoglycan lipid II flippase
MTSGVPESDSYPDSGGRGFDVRPAVPGWSAGQDYTGPLFDDTSWHIDLSDVDWGDSATRDRPERDQPDGWADRGNRTFRLEDDDRQYGSGAGPAAASFDGAPQAPPGWSDRASGRHARSARPDDETRAGPDFRPPGAQPRRVRRRVAGQPPPRTQPRRVVPSGYQPPGHDPRDHGPPGRDPQEYDPQSYRLPDHDPPGYGPARTYDPPGYQPQGYQAPPYQTPQRRPPVYEEPGYYEPGPTQALPYAPDGYQAPPPGRPLPPGPLPPGPQQPGTRPPGVRPAGPGQRLLGSRAGADAGAGSASVVRSSGLMAVGTLGSRMTGFLRTLVQNAALGAVGIAEAYNLSNTLPNVVYNLALGGILTSVIVPLIVAASRRDSDRGESYDQRMFTLITFALAGITLVATLAAVPIVYLYKGSQITGRTEHLAVIFAFFFIPQIFFYGLSSLIGAILNSRGSFAAPMWTPIVNNFVVIGVLGLYIAMGGLSKDPRTISGTEVALLGIGTTLGIVVQTAALVPALRRVGFRWHPRLDFRRAEITEIGRMGGWMFGYIAATQVAFLVTTRIAGDTGNGITVYNYSWLLFQLPYAVVGISVITALLPRMSAHASQRRFGLVRQDFSTGVRLASAIVVPCSLVLAVLGPKLGEVFFAHGRTHLQAAHYMGVVFAVFCLGLLPYMIFQLQLRVFYSVHDSKTPALIGLVTMAVNIVANLIALGVLPNSDLVAGLGAGFGVANIVGMVIAWRILSTRLRGLDGYRIGRSLVRMHAATVPAALLAILVGLVFGNAYVVVIIGSGLAVGMYLLFARCLKIEELTSLSRTVLARLGR